MRIERGTPPEWDGGGGDDNVTRVLRDLYAPPASSSYWDQLESRIMERIAGSSTPTEWWEFFGGWVRVGLAAAAAAVILAGTMLVRSRENQTRMAYEAVMESASVIPVAGPTMASDQGRGSRDATLRSIMSY